MVAHWQNEKDAIAEIRARKEQLEAARTEAEKAERDGDLERAARAALRHDARPRDRASRPAPRGSTSCSATHADAEGGGRRGGRRRDRRASGPASPSAALMEGEMAKLVRMEDALHDRVVGQEDAVDRGGERDPPVARRPVRPEPADRLVPVPRPHRRRQDRARPHARRLPVRRRAGDGAHRHVASTWRSTRCRASSVRLPGYVGYEEGGQLTEAVRRRPYAVDAARRGREGPPRRLQRAARSCWTTAASPTARAARSTSPTPC